jgi:hypothetical protein
MRALVIAGCIALLSGCAGEGKWVRAGSTTEAAPEDLAACERLARRVEASNLAQGPASPAAQRLEGNSPLGSSGGALPGGDPRNPIVSGDPQAVFRTCMRSRGYEPAPPAP